MIIVANLMPTKADATPEDGTRFGVVTFRPDKGQPFMNEADLEQLRLSLGKASLELPAAPDDGRNQLQNAHLSFPVDCPLGGILGTPAREPDAGGQQPNHHFVNPNLLDYALRTYQEDTVNQIAVVACYADPHDSSKQPIVRAWPTYDQAS